MENSDAISSSLSGILEIFLGTNEMVYSRRRMFNIHSAFISLGRGDSRAIICGSGREGLGYSSDLDLMVTCKCVVVDHHSDLLSDMSTFRMIYDQQHRGSVLIEHKNNNVSHVYDAGFNYRGRNVLSSALYRDRMLSAYRGYTINGPCLSSVPKKGFEPVDVCYSFHCPSWPSIANEFVHRKRKYGWPSSAVISDIVNEGCYCVPIGDKTSEHNFLQWRISFAPAEVRLVHTFSHCECKVYVLLKILNNDILKKKVDYTDGEPLLCSYHIKTIMFLMKENSPPSFWREDNMLNCFWMCFNCLIESVEKGFLCHYFLPGNNLFQRRIHGRNRHSLLKCLYSLRHKRIGVLYACSSLEPYLVRAAAGRNFNMTPAEKELNHDKLTTVLFKISDNIQMSMNDAMPPSMNDGNVRLIHCVLNVLKNTSDICMFKSLNYLTKVLIKKSFTLLKSMRESNLDNRTLYMRRRMYRHCLLFGTNIDVSAGWLHLATYHYIIGQYRQALTICQHVMTSIKPWTILDGDFIQIEAYKQKFCGQGIDLLSKMKRAFADIVCISKRKGTLHLNEITPEFETSDVLIYPQPYAAFLSFLCCRQMTDVPSQHTTLSDLLALQYDEIQGERPERPYSYIIYNLIGICYEQLGDYHNAVINYLKSAGHNHDHASVAQKRADRVCQCMRREN